MAEFELAYNITLEHEGGYVNDPYDIGGETYRGIARSYNPDWEGWLIIDNAKHQDNFPNSLKDSIVLSNMVKRFYKQNYWNLFWGDKISNQDIANELFDTAVNMGVYTSVKYLQISLNILNRSGSLYPDIVEDGKFGTNTLNTLNKYLSIDKASLLYKVMNILQGMHYIDYMRRSPIQERYARGWFSRVRFIKE